MYPGISDLQHPPPEIVREVFQIMSMWLAFEDAIAKLKPAQKRSLEDQAKADGCSLDFLGFDKNYEAEHCSVATYVARIWNDYERYAGRDLNSHMPVLEKHRAMVVKFGATKGPLKFKDLQALLRAQIGPVFH